MARIAFILLCHKDPKAVVEQATQLTAAGDYISIHFDKRSGDGLYREITDALSDNPNVTFVKKRLKCGWGEWSLVDATLRAVQAAEEAFPRATHFYMLSGDCMPTKTADYMHAFLDRNDKDYIESFDFFESGWIKTGIQEDRLIYRHYFNERKNKKLFYNSLKLQRKLGLTRDIPADLTMRIGSQWWCLRRQTIELLLDFVRQRKDVMKFFSTTWIPDETFFQTLVPHLIAEHEIETRTLTFLMFTDYGMPVVFYNDHYDLLIAQDYLFARKISPNADELKLRLGALFNAKDVHFDISNEGRSVFEFLSGRGRVGKRFASRFWETESSLGRDRTLLMIACKKWHVAKRLVDRIHSETKITALEYIFNEHDARVPDLGGIERDLEKRTRHRRAWMRMLFDYYQTNTMIVCLDLDSNDLIKDFYHDRSTSRLLEIECDYHDAYLEGHAKRIGLAGDHMSEGAMKRLLTTVRRDVHGESDAIRDEEYDGYERISETASMTDNVESLARFLHISQERAHAILSDDSIFAD